MSSYLLFDNEGQFISILVPCLFYCLLLGFMNPLFFWTIFPYQIDVLRVFSLILKDVFSVLIVSVSACMLLILVLFAFDYCL